MKMNPVAWIDLLNSVYKNHQMPGGFERIVKSEEFAKLPLFLIPCAANQTYQFTLFSEPGDEKMFAIRYGNRVDLKNYTRDDAVRFFGRGLFQRGMVGRIKYEECSLDIDVDLIANPDLVCTDAEVMVRVAEWQIAKAMRFCTKSTIRPMASALVGDPDAVTQAARTLDVWFLGLGWVPNVRSYR